MRHGGCPSGSGRDAHGLDARPGTNEGTVDNIQRLSGRATAWRRRRSRGRPATPSPTSNCDRRRSGHSSARLPHASTAPRRPPRRHPFTCVHAALARRRHATARRHVTIDATTPRRRKLPAQLPLPRRHARVACRQVPRRGAAAGVRRGHSRTPDWRNAVHLRGLSVAHLPLSTIARPGPPVTCSRWGHSLTLVDGRYLVVIGGERRC